MAPWRSATFCFGIGAKVNQPNGKKSACEEAEGKEVQSSG